MKSLSQGAAALALVSIMVQMGGRFPGMLGTDARAQTGTTFQSPELPSSFQPFQTPTLEQIKLTLNQGMQACQLSYLNDLSEKGLGDGILSSTRQVGELFRSTQKQYKQQKKEKQEQEASSGKDSCDSKDFKWELAKTDRKRFCAASCAAPDHFDSMSCEDFYPEGDYTSKGIKDGNSRIEATIREYQVYSRYQKLAAEKCSGLELDDLKARMNLLKCQSGKMREAVKAAETMLGQILAQNQRMIDEMKATEGAMKGQLAEMEKVLVGTPNRPGLLAIQAFFEGKDYAEFSEAVAKAPDEEKEISLREDQLKQELVQGKNAQFGACLSSSAGASGSGMSGQSCLDDKGQAVPCSPLQRIQAEISQQALLSGNGQVLRTSNRVQRMEAIKRAFGDFSQRLMTQLGGAAGKDAQGKLQPGAFSNSTVVVKVDDLMNQNGESIRQLSRISGFDLGPRLRAALSGCYNAGEQWRVREANSPAYQSRQNDVRKLRTKLNQDLDSGLQKARKVYTDTLRALGYTMDKALDLTSCSVSTRTRASCAQDLNKQMQDLKAGTGSSLSSIKVPAMGKLKGFVVGCKGIDGCVRVMGEAKTQYETSLQQVVAQKNNIAAGANTAFQKAISDFAAVLSGAQGSLEASFADMNGLAGKLKAEPGELNYLDSETLETAKEGELVRPKKISGVLSAQVPPKGLVDINGTGAEKILKAAQEKAAEDKKMRLADLKDEGDQVKDLRQLGKTCRDENDPNAKDNVGSGACDVSCQEILAKDACRTQKDLSEILAGLSDYFKSSSDEENVKSLQKFVTAKNAIQALGNECASADEKRTCLICVSTKSKDFADRERPGSGSSNSASEKD
jgi:hypothetical protein